MNHVVMFSSGIGSWAAAKAVVEQHGVENTKLLFMDTQIEDEDNYRFLHEAADNVGSELVIIADGRDVFDVYKDIKFMGNSRIDPCSRILKRELADQWIESNYTVDTVRVHVGIDWTEEHRFTRMADRKLPWIYEAPLCNEPYLFTKAEILSWARKEGLTPPRMYGMGFQHANCFAGHERFITDRGVVSFESMVNETVNVIGAGKGSPWVNASVQAFGKQEIFRITVERYGTRRTIDTTLDHKWFRRIGRSKQAEVRTSDLVNGDRLVSVYARLQSNVRLSAFGIARGIVYGDGSAHHGSATNNPASIRLCGDKDRQLLKYFPLSPTSTIDGDVVVKDLPQEWKSIPPLTESKSVLLGWLSGYFAADGSVTDQVRLSSADLSSLEFVESVCAILGIGVNPIRKDMRTGYRIEPTLLYSITLVADTLRPDFFLIQEHRDRFESRSTKRPAEWRVVSVEATGRQEEVYCCVVPEGHAFALAGNIKTHNCGGFCVKSGQAQFKKLWENFPERYLEYERKEEEVYKHIGAKRPFLRKTIDGKLNYLTMREFRTMYLEPQCDIDEFDWGGCGCFSDAPEEVN